jgi:metallo-beta-lactamase family protein
MKLTSWGAAGNVTGSMHVLELESGFRILVDCGLNYEDRLRFVDNNLNFPFNPEDIDLVILTHAHVDHCGNLPNLVRQGFTGKIICTESTKDLCWYLLEDSLKVQIIHAEKLATPVRKHKKGKKKTSKPKQIRLLYHYKHIKDTLEQMMTIDFREPKQLTDFLSVELYQAGHILGAASAKLTITENNKTVNLGFTGDLGNYNSKLVVDPQPMPGLDYLVCESTYGGRWHGEERLATDVLYDYIQETCVKLNGKLVIPAFSVGRTQAIIFTLHQLYRENRLPNIKIYTDSPLAIKSTGLYTEFLDELNEEAKHFARQHGNLFQFDQLHTLSEKGHSEYISVSPEPSVIISAAGMLEGGRIQEHIRNNISFPFSTILIAGFCADGTFGNKLLQGQKTVTINGKEKEVYAKIARTDVFSAHPDHNGLMKYIENSGGNKLKKLILVHADAPSALALKKEFPDQLCLIAERGKEIVLE